MPHSKFSGAVNRIRSMHVLSVLISLVPFFSCMFVFDRKPPATAGGLSHVCFYFVRDEGTHMRSKQLATVGIVGIFFFWGGFLWKRSESVIKWVKKLGRFCC